mmetsp:Transcript_17796/g.54395  ORF Transcript_17796/g.54395 Transcript_17796/m.54395 type:complete len:682 (-) Transcript_17796:798-2843(-)
MRMFDPLGEVLQIPLIQKQTSPESQAHYLEREVHSTFEESAIASGQYHYEIALDKAKEAGQRERGLCKHKEAHGLDNVNLELSYAICLNLAHSYHVSRLYDEAVNTYSLLVKNKLYPHSGRLRVNLGNIYYARESYQVAIRMYRMALDQIPGSERRTRFNIMRNIGNAFVRLGQFTDAVQSYETILGGCQDMHTVFNLILCYYAVGDIGKMRTGVQKLVSMQQQECRVHSENALRHSPLRQHVCNSEANSKVNSHIPATTRDVFARELELRQNELHRCILTAARLVAPMMELRTDPMFGYKFIVDALKASHESLAADLELACASHHLRRRDFPKAVDALKSFEKRDQSVKATAATNLTFIYFLEGDVAVAQHYADLAYEFDRYNARALVNKGNCLIVNRDYALAKQFYLEAVGVEADCVEAIYNLGLVNLKLSAWTDALCAFEKLHQLVPNSAEVIFQVAVVHELRGRTDIALRWYTILATHVPCDAHVLLKLGHLFGNADELQALHFHLESYRHFPASLDVISWLGVWYVKSEMYDKAVHFFRRASQIQPHEAKWQLMVTSCFRRMGEIHRALALYKQIYSKYPENTESVRYLIAICKDLGYDCEVYQSKLASVERASDTHISEYLGARDSTSRMPLPDSSLIHDPRLSSKVLQEDMRAGIDASKLVDFDDADVAGLLPG